MQEIDIQTGQLLWEWHALGHVPVSSSYVGPPADGSPFDFFHVNSIQEPPDGDLLISARNTWAVYRVDRATGAIEWQLGGKNGSFTMGAGTQFEWQHDARVQADGSLTLFNDAAAPKEENESRAMRLQLDLGAMSASLMSAYVRTPSVLAGSQGSMQLLPNGNVFVGWGDQPNFSEFTRDGKLIFDAAFPGPIQSYRAYRYVWTGRPADPPSIAIGPASGICSRSTPAGTAPPGSQAGKYWPVHPRDRHAGHCLGAGHRLRNGHLGGDLARLPVRLCARQRGTRHRHDHPHSLTVSACSCGVRLCPLFMTALPAWPWS